MKTILIEKTEKEDTRFGIDIEIYLAHALINGEKRGIYGEGSTREVALWSLMARYGGHFGIKIEDNAVNAPKEKTLLEEAIEFVNNVCAECERRNKPEPVQFAVSKATYGAIENDLKKNPYYVDDDKRPRTVRGIPIIIDNSIPFGGIKPVYEGEFFGMPVIADNSVPFAELRTEAQTVKIEEGEGIKERVEKARLFITSNTIPDFQVLRWRLGEILKLIDAILPEESE